MALLIVAMMIPIMVVGVFGFLIWVVIQARQAAQFRKMIQTVAAQTSNVAAAPVGPQWKIKYRVGTKTREGIFNGKDEAEALLECTKTYGQRSIVSSERV